MIVTVVTLYQFFKHFFRYNVYLYIRFKAESILEGVEHHLPMFRLTVLFVGASDIGGLHKGSRRVVFTNTTQIMISKLML